MTRRGVAGNRGRHVSPPQRAAGFRTRHEGVRHGTQGHDREHGQGPARDGRCEKGPQGGEGRAARQGDDGRADEAHERPRRGRAGARRERGADAGQGDDRRDGGEGPVEEPGRQEPGGHAVRRHHPRDRCQGDRREVQEARARSFCRGEGVLGIRRRIGDQLRCSNHGRDWGRCQRPGEWKHRCSARASCPLRTRADETPGHHAPS